MTSGMPRRIGDGGGDDSLTAEGELGIYFAIVSNSLPLASSGGHVAKAIRHLIFVTHSILLLLLLDMEQTYVQS